MPPYPCGPPPPARLCRTPCSHFSATLTLPQVPHAYTLHQAWGHTAPPSPCPRSPMHIPYIRHGVTQHHPPLAPGSPCTYPTSGMVSHSTTLPLPQVPHAHTLHQAWGHTAPPSPCPRSPMHIPYIRHGVTQRHPHLAPGPPRTYPTSGMGSQQHHKALQAVAVAV